MHSILKPYGYYDTLMNGEEPALTGLSNGANWLFDEASTSFECTYTSAALVHSVWIKFTYINLSSNNPHEGWLIDNLSYWLLDWCEYLGDNVTEKKPKSLISISPNPVTDNIRVFSKVPLSNNLDFSLFDISGKSVLEKPVLQPDEQINIAHLPKGIYVYKLYNDKGIYYSGKFIIK